MAKTSKFEHLGQWNAVAIATVVLLGFSITLGGASRVNELRVALIELAALPLLVIAVVSMLRSANIRPSRLATGILAASAALPLLQLLPLPPGIWTSLAGRDQLVLALDVAGLSPGWSSISLTPDRTWESFLALLPPIAMFVGILACSGMIRLRMIYLLGGAVLLSLLFGTAQLASGGDQLYLWRTTDPGNVVGFFANRNHLATLCLVSLPFAAVLGGRAIRKDDRRDGQVVLLLGALFVGLIVVALGVIRSRTGVILAGPTLAGSLVAAWVAAGRGRPKPVFLAIVAASAAASLAVAIFAIGPIIQRFDTTGAREGRFENWPYIADAANTFLPLGSGIGSFDAVFRSVEPLELLDSTYFNQAHNDYLETWLEAGWLGAALIATFLLWFIRRALAAWRARGSTERDLQRAASVAISAMLLHSAVDYPLRTITLATVFALLCGILELAARTDDSLNDGSRRRRR